MSDRWPSVGLDEVCFPVSKVGFHLQRVDNKELIAYATKHWAIVDDDRGTVFSVVTGDYELVTNKKASELGEKAFSFFLGCEELAGLKLFNVLTPKTRSWVRMDFVSKDLVFEPRLGDRWSPFLRVTNSYNRTMALQFTIGICRWICKNGIIFGEQSLTLKATHHKGVNLVDMIAKALSSGHTRFDFAKAKSRLARLVNLHVPVNQFVAGSLEILNLKVPETMPKTPLHARGWPHLGTHLENLGTKYAKELGENAYAMLNAASDYAGDVNAPRMTPMLSNIYQSRCGRWVETMATQPSSLPTIPVEIAAENVEAAERLMSFNSQP